MKKWICTWICLLALVSLSVCALAQTPKIVDNAGLLRASERAALENQAEALSDRLEMDIVIVTVETTGNVDAQVYADDFFDDRGYGYGEEHSGILLLLVMDTRDWVISTSGEGIQRLTRKEANRLFDGVAGDISAGRYYDGFTQYLADMPSYLEETEGGFSLGSLLICLILGMAVGGITLLIMRGAMKTDKRQHSAASYVIPGSYQLMGRRDFFLYSRTTRIKRADNNNSGTHMSSSGHSHGGSRGKF